MLRTGTHRAIKIWMSDWITHWGRVTHICVSKLIINSSDNGLSPGQHQAIIWINAGTILIGPSGTNFSEKSIEIHTFSFKKCIEMSSLTWRQFCLGLNMLTWIRQEYWENQVKHKDNITSVMKIRTICHARGLWKLARSYKQLRLLCPTDPWKLPGTLLLSEFQISQWHPLSKTVFSKCSFIWNKAPVNIWDDRKTQK